MISHSKLHYFVLKTSTTHFASMAESSKTGSWINVSFNKALYGHSLLLFAPNQNTLYKFQQDGSFKYWSHLDTNPWFKHHSFSDINFGPSSRFLKVRNAPFVCTDDTIYIYDSHGKLLIMDIFDADDHQIIKSLPSIGYEGQGIVINNEFHVVGGSENTKHLEWNNCSKTMDTMQDLENMGLNPIGHHRLIQVQDKVLMLGGYDYNMRRAADKICEYDIKNDRWKVLGFILPEKLYGFGCVSVLDDQFIVLLGGKSALSIEDDDIWIYCVGSERFTKSKVKCLISGECHACVIGDEYKDQMMVFGYIRRQWSSSQIDDHLFPPEHLIKIMGQYYMNQEIHLYHYGGSAQGNHWKIDVFDILA